MTTASTPGIAVVGIHGHGASHVAAARALDAAGVVRLVALVDPRTPEEADRVAGVAYFPSLADCLAEQRPDVVVLSTPIHTHRELATLALEAGADVLLEKPPVTSLAEFQQLSEVIERTGRLVQVGFQSLGSGGIGAVERLVADGTIGSVTSLGATGCWVRTAAYWTRAAWSGHRTLGGVPVVDGVVTNPLAHAVQTMLRLGGITRAGQIESIELDQYRANDIEADDTSVVRVRTTDGTPMTAALTLCGTSRREPCVTVYGTEGLIRFFYTLDVVQVERTGAFEPATTVHDRLGLLEDLVAVRAERASGADTGTHAADGAQRGLVCDFRETEAFTAVLDAVRAADAPTPIGHEHVGWHGTGEERNPVIDGIDELVTRAAAEGLTFAELGVPWAGTAVPV